RYVEIETPSRHAAGIDDLAGVIAAELAEAGATVVSHDAPGYGRNLVATVEGESAELPPLVILAHIDTVHPVGTLATMPFAVRDGRAEGPGIYDMKTGVALVVEALSRLHAAGARPRRTVRFLVTCDEEVGSYSARPLIKAAAEGAYAALVPEPSMPDGSIKTARK